MIRAAVSGSGSMGAQVIAALEAQDDIEPVGVVEPLAGGPGEHRSPGGGAYPLEADPAALFARVAPDVAVDFTHAAFTPALAEACLAHGVRPVIGTSGQPEAFAGSLAERLAARRLGGVIAPNFAIGAVLLMRLAALAAPHFEAVEVIELHHDGKADSPSGTAVATARQLRAARGRDFSHRAPDLKALAGARGAELGGVALHSVRLPGLVAHQEVIFGGAGQTLTLRHDSTGRDSFMPGVLLAVREVMRREGLVHGLGALLGLDEDAGAGARLIEAKRRSGRGRRAEPGTAYGSIWTDEERQRLAASIAEHGRAPGIRAFLADHPHRTVEGARYQIGRRLR